MILAPSELILNPDGSIYHLGLRPNQIAPTIITVGDPDRVDKVAEHFDAITTSIQRREFKTITGTYRSKPITVISTGIGTDNIDIVLNELDALVNIDFENRTLKKTLKSLNVIRVGTSGAIQKEIPLDSLLVSNAAIGFDNLMHFYDSKKHHIDGVPQALSKHLKLSIERGLPYAIAADKSLLNHFSDPQLLQGITATNVGFYGPQGRTIRGPLSDTTMNTKLASFEFENQKITNLEMETSGIYGLSKLFGHRAISLNAILANRAHGTFSQNPQQTIDKLIQFSLDKISTLS